MELIKWYSSIGRGIYIIYKFYWNLQGVSLWNGQIILLFYYLCGNYPLYLFFMHSHLYFLLSME